MFVPLASTQDMRNRLRELAMPPRDDFDRAVLIVLDDFDRLLDKVNRVTKNERPPDHT